MTVDIAQRPRVERNAGLPGRSSPGVTKALFVNEAVRALRHPVTIAAVALQTALWLYEYFGTAGWGRFPVMTDVDHVTQVPLMLLLGSASFLTGNLAVIRSARFRTDPSFVVMPLPAQQRTLATVLSTTAVGVLALLLSVAHLTILQSSTFAAGSVNGYEILAGPIVVFMMGFSGLLLGLFVKSPATAPLTLLAFGAVMALASFPAGLGASRFRWLLPLAVDDLTAFPIPGHLLDRPAASHLLYVIGLCLLLGTAAVGRSAARQTLVWVGAAALAVLIAFAGYAQLSGPSRRLVDARTEATLRPAAQQTCETQQDVTYCAFDQFRPWIREWQRVTEAVLAGIPGSHPHLNVRQRVFVAGRRVGGVGDVPPAPPQWRQDDKHAGTPDAVALGTTWGTGEGEVELAASVAARVVTGGPTKSGITPICGGRAIAIMWLAGHADARALEQMKRSAENGSGDLILMPAGFNDGLAFNRQDLGVALSLLDQPHGGVSTQWDVLTSAGTTTGEAAKLLGVAAPGEPPLEEMWC